MAKNWWFKFDFKVWRTDSNLRRCSLETKGFWLELLCIMHEAGESSVTGSYEELGRLVGCESAVAARCVIELQRTKTANVTNGHDEVTIKSRRLENDLNAKEGNKLRKQKERSHKDVTNKSQDRVISKSKSNKKEEENAHVFSSSPTRVKPISEEEESHLANCLNALRKSLAVVILPDERGWSEMIEWAWQNQFTPDQVVGCFEFLSNQAWRDSAVKPKHVIDNLPKFVKETNGVTNANQKLRTPAQVQAEMEEHAKLPRADPAEFMRGLQSEGRTH